MFTSIFSLIMALLLFCYIQYFVLKGQYWKFAHLLITQSLRSLMTKEWVWANCSGCSPKMSNRERFAQIAHQKWVTMSKSLRSLTKNEQMIESLGFFYKSRIPSENQWGNSQPCKRANHMIKVIWWLVTTRNICSGKTRQTGKGLDSIPNRLQPCSHSCEDSCMKCIAKLCLSCMCQYALRLKLLPSAR